jgi:hypothetical protein
VTRDLVRTPGEYATRGPRSQAATFALMTTPVETDFLGDLRRMIIARLTGMGYTADANLGTEALLRNLLKIQHRRIPRRERVTLWSLDLRAREATLPDQIWSGLGRIVIASETGEDLNPFLSRDLANDKAFKRNDLMLNELGAHHFHLGDGVDERGLVRGTSELLFAYVTDDAVHLVEIFDHDSFGDERAFRIAQENWPHLFEAQRAGVVPSSDPQSLTREQRKVLRRKHANVMVSASDGALFMPPGGGITPSGMSPRVAIAADTILGRLQGWEAWCKANGDVLAERVEQQTGTRPGSFHLRFDSFEESGVLVVVDDDCRACFRFDQGDGTRS